MTATTSAPIETRSSRDILRGWYAEHTGHVYRCNDIAASLWRDGITLGAEDERALTHKVATFSYRIWQRGEIDRARVETPGLSQPVTYYGIAKARADTKEKKKK